LPSEDTTPPVTKMYFADIAPSVLENYVPGEIASFSPPF